MSSSGIAGMYLKARTGSGSKLFYYKLPRYNGVVIDGYECVNVLMASRLMDVLGALRALPRSSSRANQVLLRKRSVGSSAAAQTRRCRRLRSSRGRRGQRSTWPSDGCGRLSTSRKPIGRLPGAGKAQSRLYLARLRIRYICLIVCGPS